MKLTAITATWQRPEAMALSHKYIKRQTRLPDQWLVLDGPEKMGFKLLKAFEGGKVKGDGLVIWEDDDWYDPTWLEWCEEWLSKGYDIVGEGQAIYYNVRWRWWSNCENARHASLCQTALTSNLIPTFCSIITAFDNQWFDTRLWRLERNRHLRLPGDGPRRVIGMKSLPGTTGYSGEHVAMLPNHAHADPDLKKLRELIGKDAKAYAPFFKAEEDLTKLAGA